jgi:hypothetical protein
MADDQAVNSAMLKQMLAQVPGVQRVHFDRDTAGALHDLCVEVAPQSDARHIVGRIRSILADNRPHGQPEPAICLVAAALPPAADFRIQLRELIHTRGEAIVTVTLAHQGRRVVGIGRDNGGVAASLEFLAGEATVRALNRLIEPTAQIRLDQVDRTQIGQLELCLVQITLIAEHDQQTAIGVSRIQNDSAEAAARAVLDAANRRLARLVTSPG